MIHLPLPVAKVPPSRGDRQATIYSCRSDVVICEWIHREIAAYRACEVPSRTICNLQKERRSALCGERTLANMRGSTWHWIWPTYPSTIYVWSWPSYQISRRPCTSRKTYVRSCEDAYLNMWTDYNSTSKTRATACCCVPRS